MKSQYDIDSLIPRYLSGECDEMERQQLLDWVDQSLQNKKDFLAYKDIWDVSRRISDRSEDQLLRFYKNQYQKSRDSKIFILRAAAAVAAVLVVSLITAILFQVNDQSASENLQVFSVPLGSRSRVLLADGTEVHLNSGSELTYPGNYSSKNRNVTLTGEAFFHVKTDPEHPFIVKTKDFDIKVTGTQFNVCSYNEDAFSTATLAEGKISLALLNRETELNVEPGQKFILDRNARKYTLSAANIEQETSWKEGLFIFKNIPFPELVQRLERWYDVKLTFSDNKLMELSYSGRFKNQETIWQVLDALKLTSPIDYRKTSFREFELTCKPVTKSR